MMAAGSLSKKAIPGYDAITQKARGRFPSEGLPAPCGVFSCSQLGWAERGCGERNYEVTELSIFTP